LSQEIKKYFAFIKKNKSTYLVFGKQLLISEVAGLVVGILVAEGLSAYFFFDKKIDVPLYSGIGDYAASILAFLVIYYHDNKRYYKEDKGLLRIGKIIKSAFSIWTSVIIADIAYIICRPYLHYLLMIYGLETGIAATIAHFAAFGIFNTVAILSRSMVDYIRN